MNPEDQLDHLIDAHLAGNPWATDDPSLAEHLREVLVARDAVIDDSRRCLEPSARPPARDEAHGVRVKHHRVVNVVQNSPGRLAQ